MLAKECHVKHVEQISLGLIGLRRTASGNSDPHSYPFFLFLHHSLLAVSAIRTLISLLTVYLGLNFPLKASRRAAVDLTLASVADSGYNDNDAAEVIKE